MQRKLLKTLGEWIIWSRVFYYYRDIIFSELSPRPHDTGMVTMYTQNLSEFDLHARAILSYPINNILMLREGYSTVIKANGLKIRILIINFQV